MKDKDRNNHIEELFEFEKEMNKKNEIDKPKKKTKLISILLALGIALLTISSLIYALIQAFYNSTLF